MFKGSRAKVKFIFSSKYKVLAEEIERFISDKKVIDIKYCIETSNHYAPVYSTMIIYKK